MSHTVEVNCMGFLHSNILKIFTGFTGMWLIRAGLPGPKA